MKTIGYGIGALLVGVGYRHITGLGRWDTFMELLMLGIVTAVVCYGVMTVVTGLTENPDLAANVALVAVIYLVGTHNAMSVKLRDLRQEFYVAGGGSPQVTWSDYDAEMTRASFGGSLDAVVAKRRVFLKRHGCWCFGSWFWTRSAGATTHSVYLCHNPIRLFFPKG